jgi:hypothetical protein
MPPASDRRRSAEAFDGDGLLRVDATVKPNEGFKVAIFIELSDAQ